MPPEKPININDLGLILEVNKKVIEIETEVANQNELIIEALDTIKKPVLDRTVENKIESIFKEKTEPYLKDIENKSDKIIKQGEDLSRDLFQVKILFLGGILSLVVQVIQIFIKK